MLRHSGGSRNPGKVVDVHMPVWLEPRGTMESAILREKSIKGWKRPGKLELLERSSPDWKDLYADICRQLDPGFRRDDGKKV